MSHRRPYTGGGFVFQPPTRPVSTDAQTLRPSRERGWQSDGLVDWSVRRGDFGLGGLARQRIVGAFVKLPDAIAVEPLFFHFQIRT